MKKILGALFVVGVVGLAASTVGGGEVKVPNPRFTNPHFCTLGDRDFKEYRYSQRVPVCNRNVTYSLRKKIYRLYGVPKEFRKDYTIDHLVPLSLGGSNDIKNLWPQPKRQLTAPLETKLYFKVKKGSISVQEAWNTILTVKYNNHTD